MENRNEVTITFDAYSVNEASRGWWQLRLRRNLTRHWMRSRISRQRYRRRSQTRSFTDMRRQRERFTWRLLREEDELTVSVEDFGKGIADIEKAKEPFFTTKPELERSGMGFAFMEAFMDSVLVESVPGTGTKVTMKKYIRSGEA